MVLDFFAVRRIGKTYLSVARKENMPGGRFFRSWERPADRFDPYLSTIIDESRQ